MEKEYSFWMSERKVSFSAGNGGSDLVLNLFNVTNFSPRPESYLEDFEIAQRLPTPSQQSAFYANVASGAETGWDFSTRWMPEFATSMETLVTNSIVPVDLNSILFRVEVVLADLFASAGFSSKAAKYSSAAQVRQLALSKMLWDANELIWRDFNWRRGSFQHGHAQFYSSNLMPIWAGCAPQITTQNVEELLKKYSAPLSQFPGGVPTSAVNSGQQWDFPNAWAPLQAFSIEAMENLYAATGSQTAQALSHDLALRWLTSNFCAWQATVKNGDGDMFEKYNVNRVGLPGGGGEYTVQTGFGWTNGVALSLLTKLAKQGSLPDTFSCPNGDT